MALQSKSSDGKTAVQHAIAIVVLTGLLYVIRYHVLGSEFTGRSYAETTLLLGFVLIVAYLAGIVSARFGLPRITGYLFSGILFGPSILGFATHETVNQLKVIDGMAVALIALTAGGEIKLDELKHIRKPLMWIVSATMLFSFLGVTGLVLIVSRWFPFFTGPESLGQWIAVAILLGTIAMASSPTVVIAVISETKAKGEVSELILGTTVIKDMAVVILFAIALSFALIFNNPGATFDVMKIVGAVSEVLLSLLIGLILGWLLGLYINRIGREMVLVVLGLCLLVAEIGLNYHLEPLSICLAAGFYIENFSGTKGDVFISAVKKLSLPVFALFFCVIGLELDLRSLASIWIITLVLVVARGAMIWLGTITGSRIGKAGPIMKRLGWLGFISQAGVSIGLAVTIGRTFPNWGTQLETLIISMVTVHEIVGPILLKFALDQSGETKAVAGKQ